jgi:Icc-related predicted phosphoesterase
MKIVLIADTHEQEQSVAIPPCDLLIHAGDLTFWGEYLRVLKALTWLDKQPATDIVLIAGNHDWLFDTSPEDAKTLLKGTRIHYLENSGMTLNGLTFWGSPITPAFMGWAFNCDRADIFKYWDQIPEKTDILITHGPPLGILDQAAPHLKNSESLGCYDLRKYVNKINPKIHVFGHIHGGYGFYENDETQFYNASVLNEAYNVTNAPWVVEI